MGINLIVAVTDFDWFDTLSKKSPLNEVNFWAPSAVNFRALAAGELFLFKLHAPHNFIVGGGVFAHANSLPCSLAWEAFGEANGATSLKEMRQRILKYRKLKHDDRSDFLIGCRIITQPFFLPRTRWIPVPQSWSPNIVTFKTYSTNSEEGTALWNGARGFVENEVNRIQEPPARYGEPQLVRPRLGQGAFRILVTDSYKRQCAVTGEKTLPALEAAHIRPYSEGGSHSLNNGLLLRRDIHSLFDAGYVTVTPDLHFEVSKRIREEFENGRHYYALHGQKITSPAAREAQPDIVALAWHNTERFRE